VAPPNGSGHALLLPGSIGMGHAALADAVGESLHARGWTTTSADVMAMLGGVGHRLGEKVFRSMLAVPGVFDALHFGALRQGNVVADWIDARAVGRIVPRLRDLLREEPADLVVSVFATASAATARVRREQPALRAITFCSDLNPHRLWVHPGIDCYMVKSATSERFVRRFDPHADVVVVPTPVRAAFYDAPPRPQAREALGVPLDAPCAALLGGGWGLGPLPDAAAALASAGVHTLAVAGHNVAAERKLRAAATDEPRLHPFGFTDRVAELMAAADIVVTTSGDTCAEARVIGRKLVLLDVVAGHGRENLQHELAQGGAAIASTSPELLVATVLREIESGDDPAPDADRRARWESGLDAALATIRH
jgi:processive 1,2-diacylglycerol beta-glucosyltransferase